MTRKEFRKRRLNAAEIDAYDLTTLGCIYTNLSRAYILSLQPKTILTLLEIINIQRESLEWISGKFDNEKPYCTYYERTLDDGSIIPTTNDIAGKALERTDALIKRLE